MKTTKFLILLAIVILLAIGGVAIYYGTFKVVNSKTYNLHITIADKVGFNLDNSTETIFFGTVRPEGAIGKTINITNKYDKPVKTIYKASGPISNWLTTPKSSIIQPGEVYSAGFDVAPPKDTPFDNYTGKLTILLLKT
ncbi:MAG: hypothetical protein U9R08_06820 [Nanoarchaeota archaeon]|nr:hypothetical protein [Nanoarchaeota archaeon]